MKKREINQEQLMEVKRFLTFSIKISLILLTSCESNDRFYANIRKHELCLIACDITSPNQTTMSVIMEKHELRHLFEKFGEFYDDSKLIVSINNQIPIRVGKDLYFELYERQVVPQMRVDSLFHLDVDSLFKTYSKVRFLESPLQNENLMEELYLIKRLFALKILLQQDCESGYYFILE